MTTATIPTTAPLCESIIALLTWLLGSGAGALHLDARSEAGLGHHVLSIAEIEPGIVPEPILALLEHRLGWHLRVSPAVRERDNPTLVLRTNICFVRWVIAPLFGHESAWQHQIPSDVVTRIAQRIHAFPLPPSAVIDGAKEIVAVWTLREPIDLRTPAALDRALALQARLAGALEASTDAIPHDDHRAHDVRSRLPLCGRVREMGRTDHVVHISQLRIEHVYTPEQLDAAIKKEESV